MNILKFSATSLLLVPFIVSAQDYKIEGKIENLNAEAKIFLYKGNSIDSATVNNGSFTLTGTVESPILSRIAVSHDGKPLGNRIADIKSFFLDAGTIKVSGKDSIKYAEISGTPVTIEYNALQESLAAVKADQRALNKQYYDTPADQRSTPEFRDKFDAEYERISKETERIEEDYIKKHPNSYISIYTLSSSYHPARYEDKLESGKLLYNGLSDRLKETALAKTYLETVAKVENVGIGKSAPLFTQNDPEGKPVSLASFKGKYVLVDFWASWCGPCRQENPNLVSAYNKFKDKNFTVLGVSLDQPNGKEKWLEAIAKDELAWTHVSDLKFWKNEAAQLYGIQAIPANFLIDPNGVIVAKNLRGEELHSKLAELIK